MAVLAKFYNAETNTWEEANVFKGTQEHIDAPTVERLITRYFESADSDVTITPVWGGVYNLKSPQHITVTAPGVPESDFDKANSFSVRWEGDFIPEITFDSDIEWHWIDDKEPEWSYSGEFNVAYSSDSSVLCIGVTYY